MTSPEKPDISLKGGVLIIGSLYWDTDEIRREWYEQSLNLRSEIRGVPVPIRYGRISEKRNCTFTMVFSTECDADEKKGAAIFVPFTNNPISLNSLKAQADKLIKAEYKKRTLNFKAYYWNWAALGLLVNPNAPTKNAKEQVPALLEEWKKNYRGFDGTLYRIGDEAPVLDNDGIFQFSWPQELNDYDFLIATATMPNVKSYPEAKNIAERMRVNEYDAYYTGNRAQGINTFQDKDIDKFRRD